jgi:hypothetical protein
VIGGFFEIIFTLLVLNIGSNASTYSPRLVLTCHHDNKRRLVFLVYLLEKFLTKYLQLE